VQPNTDTEQVTYTQEPSLNACWLIAEPTCTQEPPRQEKSHILRSEKSNSVDLHNLPVGESQIDFKTDHLAAPSLIENRVETSVDRNGKQKSGLLLKREYDENRDATRDENMNVQDSSPSSLIFKSENVLHGNVLDGSDDCMENVDIDAARGARRVEGHSNTSNSHVVQTPYFSIQTASPVCSCGEETFYTLITITWFVDLECG
jgi:hypothetical protein